MGQRFYEQQLQALGNCPGNKNPNKRSRKVAWDDEKKAQAVSMYEEMEPTPETSMEIVKGIADVYVKKAPAAKAASTGAATGGTRVSKAAAAEALIAAITDAGKEVDEEIISKLTGKAAQYFTTLLGE